MQKSNKDIILLSVLVSFWAIQATVILQQLLGLGHAPLLINDQLLPESVGRVYAKWDLLIYIFFIAVALALGQIVFKYYHKSVNYWFLAFEGVVTFLMVSAAFKIVIYDNSPKLAQRCLIALMVVAATAKIFYPELKRLTTDVYQRLNRIVWAPYADIWWVALIVLMIYMPDVERVMAMIYMGECMHHFDIFLMSPGWAALCGQLPYVDILSQYGAGLPVILAKIINVFGGFDYVPALRVLMWFVIIYFILTYFLVRYWLKSALIAGVAFLLVFRLQMFHYGVSPLVWVVPSASPVRFGLDVLWMAALLRHIRCGQSRWLLGAAIYSGFAPYYMTSAGMGVMATFYVYLLALAVLPSLNRQLLSTPVRRGWYFLSWVLPVLSAFVFLWLTFKGHIFQKEYWYNFVNYMVVWKHTGTIVMWESLKYRHFWAFFMSMVLPFTYMATLLYVGVRLYQQKASAEWLFTALLCIYGLANYEYYVVRAAITSYYVDVLPFVMVVCFWFVYALEDLSKVWQRRLKAAAVFLSFYALLTNHNYLAYPNVTNFSRSPMTDNLVIQRFPDRRGYFNVAFRVGDDKERLPVNDLGQADDDMHNEDDFKNDKEMVDYYRSHFDFKEDAGLIKQLTRPGERVALISSFETKILIQADRAPFFYNSSLLSSRPMTFRTIPWDAAWLPTIVSDTISELEARRPTYVFMEKVFLQDSLSPAYKDKRARVLAIIDYVRSHYQPFEQGKYLVAMKRKGDL